MTEAIANGVFPGASLLVAKGETIVHRGFYGNATLLPKPEPVTETTIWDIASLTKPMATAALAMASVKEKGLSLNSHAAKYLPVLHTETHRKITLRHLLKHTSGLPAWRPYFERLAKESPQDMGKQRARDRYLEYIAEEPLEAAVSFKKIYSDLGFIVLGILLENFWEMSLEQLLGEKIAGPLGLKNTFYAPIGAASPRPHAQFAATEDSAWRGRLLRGEVHDDNCYALGGVAGHAGLFSQVDDLHRFLLWIRGEFRRDAKTDRTLGWDKPEIKNSQAGKHFSKHSIGHLGYSGCSMWMDLEKDFHVVLLTNRVHPSSKNDAIKQFRPKIHDSIFEELIA